MLDFADLHKRYPLIFYGTLVEGHKALGHEVNDAFWSTWCRTCGWKADVWVKGDGFNPNVVAEWTVTTD